MSAARARALCEELIADLAHHAEWEGQEAEFRNRQGSWEDVSDRVRQIKEALS